MKRSEDFKLPEIKTNREKKPKQSEEQPVKVSSKGKKTGSKSKKDESFPDVIFEEPPDDSKQGQKKDDEFWQYYDKK